MKFIKQSDHIVQITSMILSPNKRFLAVCEKHKNDQSAYIAIYDIKTVFKQQSYKERLRLNVADLFPPGAFGMGASKDLASHHTGHHTASSSGTNQKHIISLRFSADSKYLGLLVSNDPHGNGDVKALVYSWIEPNGKESKHNHQQNMLNRVVAHFDFPKQANGQTVKRLSFNPKDNNQVVTTGHNHWKWWRL
jgi:hypothetical protein